MGTGDKCLEPIGGLRFTSQPGREDLEISLPPRWGNPAMMHVSVLPCVKSVVGGMSEWASIPQSALSTAWGGQASRGKVRKGKQRTGKQRSQHDTNHSPKTQAERQANWKQKDQGVYTYIYLSAIARPLPSLASNDLPFKYKKAVALLSSVICITRIAKNTTLRTPIVTFTCNPASSWSWKNSFKVDSQGNFVNHRLFPLSILQLTKTLSFLAIYLH